MNTGYKRRGAVAKVMLAIVLTLCMVLSSLLTAHAELDEPIMLDNCDSSTWHGSGGKNYQEKTEGNASVFWAIGKGGSFVVFRTWATPVNAEGANYLEFDIYVSDADAFYSISGGNSIELTSGGACDVEETAWNLNSLEVESGWNHISLPVAGGGCDLSRVNYMRFYALGHNNEAPYTIMIDNIQLVYRDPSDIGGYEVPDDYIIGTQDATTAIPVIPVKDETTGDDNTENEDNTTEGNSSQGGEQTETTGCGAVMSLGTGAMLLLAGAWTAVATRKKMQGGKDE